MSEATRPEPSVGKQLPNKDFAVTDALPKDYFEGLYDFVFAFQELSDSEGQLKKARSCLISQVVAMEITERATDRAKESWPSL